MKGLFQKGQVEIVSDLVVAEAYFALRAHYQVPKEDAVQALIKFLKSPFIAIEEGGCALDALSDMVGVPAKPGFVDRLIHRQYQKCAGGMVSFEKAAAKLANVTILLS